MGYNLTGGAILIPPQIVTAELRSNGLASEEFKETFNGRCCGK